MIIECAGCGLEVEHNGTLYIRVGRVTGDGHVEFNPRLVCPDCVSAFGVLMPGRATRMLVAQTVERVAAAATDLLIQEAVNRRTHEAPDDPSPE